MALGKAGGSKAERALALALARSLSSLLILRAGKQDRLGEESFRSPSSAPRLVSFGPLGRPLAPLLVAGWGAPKAQPPTKVQVFKVQ